MWVSVFGGPRDELRGLEERLLGVGVRRERVWVVWEGEERMGVGKGEGEGEGVRRTMLPDGERRVKRIAWLAGVRNRVLEPLYADKGKEETGGGRGDM